MEIRPSVNSTGLSTNTGKKADVSHGVAPEKTSTQQQTSESSTVTVTDSALKLLQIQALMRKRSKALSKP